MANTLNMAIAKTHQLSSRLVGMQITTGNLIGVILSATQMSVGFEMLGQGVTKGNVVANGGIGVIGVGLAILVERLSLTGLAGVRVASEQKQRLEDAFYQLKIEREPTQAEQENFDRQIKKLEGNIKKSVFFSALGIGLSAGLGDQFWHTLFASQGVGGEVLAVACAAVISLTFLHSELYKTLVDGVLKEILADLHLMKVAVAAQEQVMQVDMMVESYDEVRKDEELYQPSKNKVKKIVGRRLAGFANQVSLVGNEMDALNQVKVVEGSLAPLALPAPRGKYHLYREELRRLLSANPSLTQRDVAEHFKVSRSTAKDWFDKVKRGE